MGLNKSFAEVLLQKLTIGNSRSILLNALPGRLATRLALTDLETVKRGLAAQFLTALTSQKSFNFKFTIDLAYRSDELLRKLARVGKRLAAMKYDHDDYVKEHGIETFGFGFPIVFRRNPRDNTKFIAAPIFIFPLQIKQSYNKEREWIISRDADSEVRLNEVLVSYLENEEHMKVPPIPEEMLEDGLLDKGEIESFCKDIIALLGDRGFFSGHWEDLEELPDKLLATDPWFINNKITWNGVFGLYKSQKQAQIKDMQQLLEFIDIDSDDSHALEWETVHSPMATDPSQNSVLHSLNTTRNVVIQGPPGTGKSQTLTAIISSALANRKKVLVVCEKRTALEVLKSNLEKLVPDMQRGIALIEDTTKDRNAIVELVRNRTATHLARLHHTSSLKEDIKRFESKAAFAEQQYTALRSPRKRWWSKLVHEWMTSERTEAELIHLFSFQKIFQEQDITQEEFFALRSVMEDGAELFRKIELKYALLNALLQMPKVIPPGHDRAMMVAINDLQIKLSVLGSELAKIKAGFVGKLNAAIADIIAISKRQAEELTELKNSHAQRGADVFDPSLLTKILAIILPRKKQMLSDSGRAHELQRSLDAFKAEYTDEHMQGTLPDGHAAFFAANSAAIAEKKISQMLKQPLDIMTEHGFDAAGYGLLLANFKALSERAAGYIKNTGYSEASTLADAERQIAALAEKLKQAAAQDHAITPFVAWKAFEQDMNDVARRWSDVLLNHSSEHWIYLLEQTWLYYQLLSGDRNEKFPTDDATLEVLRTLGVRIKEEQKEAIAINLNNWFIDGQERIKALGLQINQLFNLRGPKGGTRNSLRKIVRADMEAFTSFFPVLMLNPGTCATLLPLIKASFDIVIFDEASQLRIEDTYTALLRGKQVVVSGDSQQMPPSSYFESSARLVDDEGDSDDEEDADADMNTQLLNSAAKDMAMKESLLEFAIDADYRQTYLDMHYRSRHPDLIQFSNVCFYNSRLVPMPEKSSAPPIKYVQVNGLYENRKNESEAREIIRVLRDEIDPALSVGIATFNLEQRNLILELIGDERAADEAFNQKMNQLEKSDFFVKNLENIQGDERDVILISTTFGVKKDNSFRLSFGPITQKNGYRLLNVIITRARHQMHVFTSIPELKIATYRERLNANRTVDGTTGLLAYLTYAKAVSTGNTTEKQETLDYIRTKIAMGAGAIEGSYLDRTESPFEEQVYSWLVEALGRDRVHPQYAVGGFRIDIVVVAADGSGKRLAIECDGAAYHTDLLTWHYDLYRQQQLESNGFIFHRIWSTNWWRKPKEEFQKLLEVIGRLG